MILFCGGTAGLYVIIGAYLAWYYGMGVNIAWWVILWLVSALLSMATPSVAGGIISCLSILMLQLQIPQEGLVVGATLAMFLDFLCTGAREPAMQSEIIFQAHRLGFLDHEVLRKKQQ